MSSTGALAYRGLQRHTMRVNRDILCKSTETYYASMSLFTHIQHASLQRICIYIYIYIWIVGYIRTCIHIHTTSGRAGATDSARHTCGIWLLPSGDTKPGPSRHAHTRDIRRWWPGTRACINHLHMLICWHVGRLVCVLDIDLHGSSCLVSTNTHTRVREFIRWRTHCINSRTPTRTHTYGTYTYSHGTYTLYALTYI